MEITCTQPVVLGPSRIRVSPAATTAQPARVRLEIEGGGYYRTALVDGAALIRAALAEVGGRQAVPTVILDAVLAAAWKLAEEQRTCFNPFGSCPQCQCGLWPADEWRPKETRRCENCGATVEKPDGGAT